MFGIVGYAHSAIALLAAFVPPALAIVLFTVAVRLAISPLSYLQGRAERRRAALAPQVADLREKHREDPMALATATMALHRAHGAGMSRSLLPALVQAPFFMVMYQVSLNAPAGALLGVPLAAHLTGGVAVFAGLLVIAGLIAWWSVRRSPVTGVLRYLPYLSLAAVAWMPLAGALYLVTSSAWTALEQLTLRRPA